MNLNIDFSREIEAALLRRAALQGTNVETLVKQKLIEELDEELPVPPVGETVEAYMARLRAMITRHAVRCGHVDDSRESIYAGCGE